MPFAKVLAETEKIIQKSRSPSEAGRSSEAVLRAPIVQPAVSSDSTDSLVSGATPAGKLATLRTIEPGGFNAVAEDEWVEVDVAIDSGATETVMSEETLSGVIDIKESAACKRGIVYEVADGTQIPNLGKGCFLGSWKTDPPKE